MASNTNDIPVNPDKPASSFPTNDQKRDPALKTKKPHLTFIDQVFSSLPQTEVYEGFRSIFIKHGVSSDDVVTHEDLKEIGVARNFHRKKILKAIEEIKSTSSRSGRHRTAPEFAAAPEQAGEFGADSNPDSNGPLVNQADLETSFRYCVSDDFPQFKTRFKSTCKQLQIPEFDSMTTSYEILSEFRKKWHKAKFRDTFFKVAGFEAREKDLFELHFYRYCWLIDNIDDLQENSWTRCFSRCNKGNDYVPVSVGYARGIMISAPLIIMVLASILHISGVPSQVYYSLFMVALGFFFIHNLLAAYTYYTVHYRCCDYCSWENDNDDEANIPDIEEAGVAVELISEDPNITKLANQAKSRKRVPNYRGESSSCIREILKDYLLPLLRNHQFSWFHRAFIQLWPGIFAYFFVTKLFEGDHTAGLKILGMAVIVISGHIVAIKRRNWHALVREYQWAVMFCCIKRPLVEYQQHVEFENPCSCCACC